MAEYNAENHALNLPDAYKKTTDSNNYKILEVERHAVNAVRTALQGIYDSLDINNATGKTLDLYGEKVGQSRGLASDSQYLLMIKARIARNFSNGSYESVLNGMCLTFNCEPSQIFIVESEKPCVIKEVNIPLDIINKVGLTVSQTAEIVKKILPIGVSLETFLVEGTFEFSEGESDYDDDAGFALSESDQSKGGYLGAVQGDDVILPI